METATLQEASQKTTATLVSHVEQAQLVPIQQEIEKLRANYGLLDQQPKALTSQDAQIELDKTKQEAIAKAKDFFGVTIKPPAQLSPSEQAAYQLKEYENFISDELKLMAGFGMPMMVSQPGVGKQIPEGSLVQLQATINNMNSNYLLGRLSSEVRAEIADLNQQRERLARAYGVDNFSDQVFDPKTGQPISSSDDPLQAARVRFDTVMSYAKWAAQKEGKVFSPPEGVGIYELHQRINLEHERADLVRMFGVEDASGRATDPKDSLQEASHRIEIVRQRVLEKAASVLHTSSENLIKARDPNVDEHWIDALMMNYKTQLREELNVLKSRGVYIPYFDPDTQAKLTFYSLRTLELARQQANGRGLTAVQFSIDQRLLFDEHFPAKPPITFDEVFQAKEALDEIKALRRTSPGEARRKIAQYHGKIAFQREGLQYLKRCLTDEVNFNPNIRWHNLVYSIRSFGRRYGFSESMLKRMIDRAGQYDERHQLINNIQTQRPEKMDLCEYLTGYRPQGEFTLTFGPASIEIHCQNDDDYAAIFGVGKERALQTGGVYLGLRKGVPVIALRKEDPQIVVHERQHVLNSILFLPPSGYPGVPTLENMQTAIGQKDKPLVDFYLNELMGSYFMAAKNEIVAYFVDGRWKNKTIVSCLTDKNNGLYDYSYAIRSAIERDPNIATEFKRRVEDVLVRAYDNTIVKALGVLEVLTLSGYNRKDAVELLDNVPLNQWTNSIWRLLRPPDTFHYNDAA